MMCTRTIATGAGITGSADCPPAFIRSVRLGPVRWAFGTVRSPPPPPPPGLTLHTPTCGAHIPRHARPHAHTHPSHGPHAPATLAPSSPLASVGRTCCRRRSCRPQLSPAKASGRAASPTFSSSCGSARVASSLASWTMIDTPSFHPSSATVVGPLQLPAVSGRLMDVVW